MEKSRGRFLEKIVIGETANGSAPKNSLMISVLVGKSDEIE